MTPTTRLKIDADPENLAEEGPSRGKTTQGSGKNEKAAQRLKKRGVEVSKSKARRKALKTRSPPRPSTASRPAKTCKNQ